MDDRRYGTITHLTRVISVHNLRDQVQAQCPDETPIPSKPWIHLQFWPKTQHTRSKIHHTGKLNMWFMVQARQFCKTHADTHYYAAVIWNQCELAVRLKDHSVMVLLDDKHRIKVGEPGYPVAAAERGRRVLVVRDTTFEVGDHHFTGISINASISFVINIPDMVESSW